MLSSCITSYRRVVKIERIFTCLSVFPFLPRQHDCNSGVLTLTFSYQGSKNVLKFRSPAEFFGHAGELETLLPYLLLMTVVMTILRRCSTNPPRRMVAERRCQRSCQGRSLASSFSFWSGDLIVSDPPHPALNTSAPANTLATTPSLPVLVPKPNERPLRKPQRVLRKRSRLQSKRS